MSKPRTVGELLLRLQTMVKNGTVKVTTPLIHASDDEGNSFNYVYNLPEVMLFNPDDWTIMDFDQYVEANYKDLHDNYKEWLRDSGRYDGHPDLDEVDDGWNEFVVDCMREDGNLPFTCCIN